MKNTFIITRLLFGLTIAVIVADNIFLFASHLHLLVMQHA